MKVVFVHGACVQDGAWWWEPTATVLRQHGIESASTLLPSCGETGLAPGPDGPGLAEDVRAVRATLAETAEPTVLVGHSYGGIVATEAAVGSHDVRQLVYVSSYLPEPGQSLSSFGPAEPAPFLDVDAGRGTFAVRPDLFEDAFMHDCPPDIAAAGADHLAAQSLVVVGAPVQASAWHDIASTYVVCANDRGTPPARQREFAARATRTVEVDTGHHPFLADPEHMATVVMESLRTATEG